MKASRNTVQSAARRRWPDAIVRHHEDAATPAERAVASERRRQIKARIAEIIAEQESLGYTTTALLKAARFVVDVHGDEPSISQLAEATAAAERHQELIDEKADLFLERERLQSIGVRKKWDIIAGITIRAEADTLDELLGEVENLPAYA